MALQVGIVSYSTWFSAYMPARVRGRMMGYVGATGTLFSALGPQIATWIRRALPAEFKQLKKQCDPLQIWRREGDEITSVSKLW